MPSRRPLAWGIALCVAALAIAAFGAGLAGPLDPSDPRPILSILVEAGALAVGITGGTLVAVWMGRKAAEDDAIEDADPRPPTPP